MIEGGEDDWLWAASRVIFLIECWYVYWCVCPNKQTCDHTPPCSTDQHCLRSPMVSTLGWSPSTHCHIPGNNLYSYHYNTMQHSASWKHNLNHVSPTWNMTLEEAIYLTLLISASLPQSYKYSSTVGMTFHKLPLAVVSWNPSRFLQSNHWGGESMNKLSLKWNFRHCGSLFSTDRGRGTWLVQVWYEAVKIVKHTRLGSWMTFSGD